MSRAATHTALVLLLLAAMVTVCLAVAVAALLLARPSDSPQPAAGAASPPAATQAVVEAATAQPDATASPPAPTATTGTPPAPSATPPPAPPRPTPYGPVPGQKYGLHLLLDDGRNHWPPAVWPQHLAAARRIVGEEGYVVQLVRLDDLDVERWQYFLDLCAEQRLVPIIRLAGAYDHENKWWIAPPKDADGGYGQVARRYRDFLAQLRWPAEPRYAIVYNEPNRGDEWSNRPNAAEYARLLLDVGRALHEVGITVLGPALDLYAPHSNGQLIFGHRYVDAETFLDEMAAAEPQSLEVIDVWASHAYPLDPFRFDPSRQVFQIDYANGANNPRHAEPPEGIYNRGINSYRWEMWKLEQLIGPRAREMPVLITESGWRHAPTQNADARDSVHAEVSFETLSAYLDLAFHGNQGRYPDLPAEGWTPWQDDPRVQGVVLFALGGYPKDWGHTNWVVVGEQGQVTDDYPIALRGP